MGRDCTYPASRHLASHFNPLSPHGERLQRLAGRMGAVYFNPLSPHGERPSPRQRSRSCCHFNPLSPHGERRAALAGPGTAPRNFNPLSPHGERQAQIAELEKELISIHSPRMGRDRPPCTRKTVCRYFNPLSPHGERRPAREPLPSPGHFNPLSPHGERHLGEDKWAYALNNFNPLSPHGERPAWIQPPSLLLPYFNPLSPHGERPKAGTARPSRRCISIHSPRMGRDSKRTQLFEEKNWRICTTLYLFASKGVLPADKKTF